MEAQEIFIVFYQQLLARTVDMPLGVGRVVWSFKKKESEESSTVWTVKSSDFQFHQLDACSAYYFGRVK